jgi:hypothetical protein
MVGITDFGGERERCCAILRTTMRFLSLKSKKKGRARQCDQRRDVEKHRHTNIQYVHAHAHISRGEG